MEDSAPLTQDTGLRPGDAPMVDSSALGPTSHAGMENGGVTPVPASIRVETSEGETLPCLLYFSPVQINGYGVSQQHAIQIQLLPERTGELYAGYCVVAGPTPEDRQRHADALHSVFSTGSIPRDMSGSVTFHVTQTESCVSLAVAFRREVPPGGQGGGGTGSSGSRTAAVRWTMAPEAVRSYRDDGRLPYSWGDGWLYPLEPLPAPLSALYPTLTPSHTPKGQGQAALARQLSEAQSVGASLISLLVRKLSSLSAYARQEAGRETEAQRRTQEAQGQVRALHTELQATVASRVQERAETTARMVLFVNRKKEEIRALQLEVARLKRTVEEGEKRERKAALELKRLQQDVEVYRAEGGGGAAPAAAARPVPQGSGWGKSGSSTGGGTGGGGHFITPDPASIAPLLKKEKDMDDEETDMEEEEEEEEQLGPLQGEEEEEQEEEDEGEEGGALRGAGGSSGFHRGALKAYSSQVQWSQDLHTQGVSGGTSAGASSSAGAGAGAGVARASAAARALLHAPAQGGDRGQALQGEEEEEDDQFI